MYGKLLPAMISVSHSCIASCDGAVPSRPMPPVVYGLSSGTTALPSSGLMIGPPTFRPAPAPRRAAPRQPRPARIATFDAVVDQRRRPAAASLSAAAAVAAANRSRAVAR